MKINVCKLLAVLFVCTLCDRASAGLEMTSTNSINLGKIYSSHRSTHEFHFINTGDSDIHILDIIATCPCINGNKDRDIVKPDEKFTLSVFFNAQSVHGKFTRGLWLITNDKKTAENSRQGNR